jgi:anhydro-N-acetylmuramic acid kinase
LDGWIKRHLQKDYDDHGRWAAQGEVDNALLEDMLADPYFSQPSPKSTGLEHFSMAWLDRMLGPAPRDAVNVQATLAELSVAGIAHSLVQAGLPDRLLVCGGGIHNDYLMHRLAAALPGVAVGSTAGFGADPDWAEGMLFAWLARERLYQREQDTTTITGARHAVLLGQIHEPPDRRI